MQRDDRFDSLPKSAEQVTDWSWKDVEPYYEDMLRRTLRRTDATEFLSDWTRVAEIVDEIYCRLLVATTVNTADKDAEKRYHEFLDEVYPKTETAEQSLKKKLLESGIDPEGFAVPLRKMRTEAEIFREENLPLLVQDHKLCTEYDKIMGSQTVQWEGRELTVAQLRPIYQLPDRAVREQAWRMAAARRLTDRQAIAGLWRDFMELRLRQAANAGFGDYRSYRWKQLLRFDYSPEDCMRFHEAIEETVVPAARRVYERRRRRLGLSALRPWDLDVDPLGMPPLAPFQDVSELVGKCAAIFRRLDTTFGEYFDTMVRENLLDLDNRKNKAPGGYCIEFSAVKRPFIFMNAVGLHDDVQTLLHESGHSFHGFERSRLPFYQQRQVGLEFAEVASMSMELLAFPYLSTAEGGFYSETDAARACVEHLERIILFWPYMAVVDAFQHWVYENPKESIRAERCDARWRSLWDRFMPPLDWTGLEDEQLTGWQNKLHIHTVPFYYVEYGFAQLGAVQVWSNALKDRAGAVSAYREALALGGTVPLPDLFRAAGAELAADQHATAGAVGLIEHVLGDLTDVLERAAAG